MGTLRIKYPPAKPKSRSGAHAARTGGNWLTFPMDSDKRDTMMYSSPMPTAVATPATVPLFPAARAKGIASTAIMSELSGKANFSCS